MNFNIINFWYFLCIEVSTVGLSVFLYWLIVKELTKQSEIQKLTGQSNQFHSFWVLVVCAHKHVTSIFKLNEWGLYPQRF